MKAIKPVSLNEADILNALVDATESVQKDIASRFPGLTGDAKRWQMMMGNNRSAEYLRQNGAKQRRDAWVFSDGSVLPNPV